MLKTKIGHVVIDLFHFIFFGYVFHITFIKTCEFSSQFYILFGKK